MPRNFPDWQSLINAAECHDFRAPMRDESEADYRSALADHVAPRDFIESQEIRTGKGWDKWSESDNKDMLRRKGINL